MTSTALAQGITVAVMPLLTRLYSAAEFGTLAAVVSAVTIVGSVAALRLDAAIPMAETDDDALGLIATGFAAVGATVIASLLLCLAIYIAATRANASLPSFAWLLAPAGIGVLGAFNVVQAYAVRSRDFDQIAASRIRQAATGTMAQTILGLAGLGSAGLVLGQLLLWGSGFARLAQPLRARVAQLRDSLRWSRVKHILHKYSVYPRVATLDTLANSASLHLPTVIIASLQSPTAAGLLLVAQRAGQLPLTVVGNAAAQVFTSTAAEAARNGQLGKMTADAASVLIARGTPLILVAAALGPTAAGMILGEDWTGSGELLRWMAPWMMLQLVASPISPLMLATGRQVELLKLNGAGLVVRSAAAAYGSTRGVGPELLCAASAAYYAVAIAVYFLRSGADAHLIRATLRRPVLRLVVYIALAVGIGRLVDMHTL